MNRNMRNFYGGVFATEPVILRGKTLPFRRVLDGVGTFVHPTSDPQEWEQLRSSRGTYWVSHWVVTDQAPTWPGGGSF